MVADIGGVADLRHRRDAVGSDEIDMARLISHHESSRVDRIRHHNGACRAASFGNGKGRNLIGRLVTGEKGAADHEIDLLGRLYHRLRRTGPHRTHAPAARHHIAHGGRHGNEHHQQRQQPPAHHQSELKYSSSRAVARPRWLMAFFSSGVIEANDSVYPSGRNTGS